jgi:hypothetical protein
VGTANVGSRAPACLTFYCDAAREGAHCHTRQTPPIRARLGSGNRSGDLSGDHIPNTYSLDHGILSCMMVHYTLQHQTFFFRMFSHIDTENK